MGPAAVAERLKSFGFLNDSGSGFGRADILLFEELKRTLKDETPEVIVVGSQNVGKSGFLKQLIGADVFPENEGLATRAPIELHVTTAACTYVRVHRRHGRQRVLADGEIDEWAHRLRARAGRRSPFR